MATAEINKGKRTKVFSATNAAPTPSGRHRNADTRFVGVERSPAPTALRLILSPFSLS